MAIPVRGTAPSPARHRGQSSALRDLQFRRGIAWISVPDHETDCLEASQCPVGTTFPTRPGSDRAPCGFVARAVPSAMR